MLGFATSLLSTHLLAPPRGEDLGVLQQGLHKEGHPGH